MIDFNFNVGIKEIHYPFYFEKRNICLDCGAEKSLTFINIFGNESNSEVFPYYKIKCNKCGATFSIKWDRDYDDGKIYPSAVDPSFKKNFVNMFKNKQNRVNEFIN